MDRLLIAKYLIHLSLQRFVIFFSLLFLIIGIAQAADKNEIPLYEKKLFNPQVINNFGIGDKRFQSLTSTQKADLLEIQKTLFSFLKATQIPNTDLTRFLGRSLSIQYKSRAKLLEKLLSHETEIHLVTIVGFEIGKTDTVTINYYVVLYSEGNFFLREDSANMEKEGEQWKVTSIASLNK